MLILVLLAGCGGGADLPELYETSGSATTGGAPLEAATIVMTPTAGGRPSYAEVEKDGSFKMRFTKDAEGAATGENVVSLMEPNPMPDLPPLTPELQLIFEKYAEDASPMKITIDSDKTDWELKFD